MCATETQRPLFTDQYPKSPAAPVKGCLSTRILFLTRCFQEATNQGMKTTVPPPILSDPSLLIQTAQVLPVVDSDKLACIFAEDTKCCIWRKAICPRVPGDFDLCPDQCQQEELQRCEGQFGYQSIPRPQAWEVAFAGGYTLTHG